MKEMAKATDATAKDLKQITRANQSQSASAARIAEMLNTGPRGSNGNGAPKKAARAR
jgi:hypothetical protein